MENVKPFGNMKDYTDWRNANCCKCSKFNGCLYKESIDDAIAHGEIPIVYANKIGVSNQYGKNVVLTNECHQYE